MLGAPAPNPMDDNDKLTVTPLTKLRAPLGGQEIELQQIDWAVGGLSLLRVRIREGRRFTVFDIDADTAGAWGAALLRWSNAQPAKENPIPTPSPSLEGEGKK